MVGLRGLPRLVCLLHGNSAPRNEARKKASANETKEGHVRGVHVNRAEGDIYCHMKTKSHLCVWKELVLKYVNIKTCNSLVSGTALALYLKDLSLLFFLSLSLM